MSLKDMLHAHRQAHHVYMLHVIRELVAEGVRGYATHGDDVEALHGRFLRGAPRVDPPLPQDEELAVIDQLITFQRAYCTALGVVPTGDDA